VDLYVDGERIRQLRADSHLQLARRGISNFSAPREA
jgi:hypothetical protein